jgi:capsular exopolysaccharide synthesis family protein
LNFGTLWRGIRRHPIVCLLVLVASAGAATAIWFFLPLPKMTAYATFQVSSQPQSLIVPADSRSDFMVYRQAQAALVKSRGVLNSALNQPGMKENPLLVREPDQLAWLDAHIKVDFKSSPEFMRISLEGDDGDSIKAIVEAVATAYKNQVEERETGARNRRLNKLTELSRDYATKLDGFHTKINEWATSLGSGRPENLAIKEKFMQEQLGMAEKELLQIQSDMRKALVEKEIYEKKVASTDQVVVQPGAIDDAILAALAHDTEFQKLVAREAELRDSIEQIKAALNPGARPAILVQREGQLEKVVKEIAEYKERKRPDVTARLKTELERNEQIKKAGVTDRLKLLSDLQVKVDKDVTDFRNKLRDANLGQVNLETLKQQMAQTEAMSARVNQEIENLKVESDTPPRVTPLEKPDTMQGIEGFRRVKYSALAGLAVLLLGVGLVTFLETRNRRVQTADEVSDDLGMKLIGTVPSMPRAGRGLYGLGETRAELWRSMLAESVDATRMMLVHQMNGTNCGRKLLITSAMPGEGKTMLACHLASSLARAGLNTLLVDGDLRRPTVHRILEISASPGLCEVLRGEVAPADAIRTVPDIAGLSVLPAGGWDPRIPLALNDRWAALVAQLEAGFDFVVIDSSPVLLVSDSLQMAKNVDGVVISVLRDVSPVEGVSQACERLRSLGVNVVGVVVNGLDLMAYHASYKRAYLYQATHHAAPGATAAAEQNSQSV